MTDIGSTLPSFELPDADGKSVDISKFKGKNIVLVFWCIWPCRGHDYHNVNIITHIKANWNNINPNTAI